MNDNETAEFRGFDGNSVQTTANLCSKYASAVERLEWNLNNTASSSTLRMDLSLAKCYEDTTNSCNTSFKGITADNDSGYISQNVESNSSVETAGDNRQLAVATSNVKDVYLNEDTLFEKPQIFSKQEQPEDDYEEFGHLFFMAGVPGTPILNSSVASQKTNFSGFDGDESGVSDVSGTIPIATPIKINSTVLNVDSNSTEKVSNDNLALEQNRFDPVVPNNMEFMGDLKENCRNYVNAKSNLELISSTEANVCNKGLNSTSESENNMNCIQTRMMDANNCNMSLFESFYTFVCDLYTKNDASSENLANKCINPNNLQINRPPIQENSPYKNSYLQLETKSKLNGNDIVKTADSVTPSSSETKSNSDGDNIITLNSPVIGSSKIKIKPGNNHSITSNLTVTSKTSRPLTASETNFEIVHKEEHDEVNSKNVENMRTTPLKQHREAPTTPMSPELFSDEELEPSEMRSHSISQIQKTCDQMYITKNDRKLLKHANESLGGVPPPPSVTIIQMSVVEMLQKIADNKNFFATNFDRNLTNTVNVNNSSVDNYVNCVQKEYVNTDKACDAKNRSKQQFKNCRPEIMQKRESLLVTCKKGDFDLQLWPNVMQYRYHGLHYNRSKMSEDFEHLCVKYAERYVGAETQSSCTVFGMDVFSPSKRRFKLRRLTKSPGKRLSHLARRRITFSKDSLQSGAGPSGCSFIGARTRQIMVDARKFELHSRRKSPRKRSPRKTPGKSPRRKSQTPSSSSKKLLTMRLKRGNTEDSSMDSISSSSSRASVTKRALFQSPPDKGENSNSLSLFGTNTSDSDMSESSRRRTPRRALFTSPFKASPSKMTISSLYPAKRKVTPKRALFKSPGKASPAKHSEAYDKKRKRTESDDLHPSKIARSMSLDVKNSSSDLKSRSSIRSHSSLGSGNSLQPQNVAIAEHRKKKMMWAVAEALRSQSIDLKHPNFRFCASTLAQLIRKKLPGLFIDGPRPAGSTTESMLRIARQYVFAVSRGKTMEQIILEEQNNSKPKASKPSGYVGLDKTDRLDNIAPAKNKENVLQDRVNIIGSDRLTSETNQVSKNRRGENVERIRRAINFGDDDDNTGIR